MDELVTSLPAILFYMFSALMLLSAAAVICARNPVHSVFFLILTFFNAAALLLLLGAEYLAMTLVIVYVGAVAVLFLFVVMMLNINTTELRQGFLRYLPIGLAVAGIILAELILILYNGIHAPQMTLAPAHPVPDANLTTNTHALGHILYTDYVYPFQISGLILLVAMIGAIVLTHRTRAGVRRQHISKQVARKREDAIAIVKVESGRGV